MNETIVVREGRGRDARTLALWVLGASAIGSVVPNILLVVFGGAAMMVIGVLDLGRNPGTGMYLVACVSCVVVYWAMLHGAMRAIPRVAEVPKAVWPALLVWPTIWITASVFADPRGVLEPAPAVLGAAGVLLAWLTTGRLRARKAGPPTPDAAARWPYGVGLASAVMAIMGMVYAPFAGIVYFLALPGVLLSAVWAWLHHSPARAPLGTSAGLLLLGFLGGLGALALSRVDPAVADLGYQEWVAATAFVILVALPGMSLLLTVAFEIIGLRRPGTILPGQRAGSRRPAVPGGA